MYKVSSEEEAVALANNTQYGLGSYLITADAEQAERIADQIDADVVYVNIVGADSSGASSAATAPTSSSTRS